MRYGEESVVRRTVVKPSFVPRKRCAYMAADSVLGV